MAFAQENQAVRGLWRFSEKYRLLKSKHEMLFLLQSEEGRRRTAGKLAVALL